MNNNRREEENRSKLYIKKKLNFHFEIELKQAENGLQLRSGCHGLSWTVMDDFHG